MIALPLTRTRLRAYCTLIALTMWSVWIVDVAVPGPLDRLGKVKGTDFLQFYVAGTFVREGHLGDYYDVTKAYARAQAIATTSRETLYLPIQSPQTALAFAPLAAFRYPIAFLLWTAGIVAIYGAVIWLLWRDCPPLHRFPRESVAAAAAFSGVYSTVLHGQLSIVVMTAVAIAIYALRRQSTLAAGLALGCVVFKPHWLAAAGAVFVFAREWRVVAAIAISAVAQLAATTAIVGVPIVTSYVRMLRSAQGIAEVLEPQPSDSLRGFLTVFARVEPLVTVLYGAAALAVLLLTAKIWRSDRPFEVRAAALVLAIVLVSPHALAYDLLTLAPVFVLLASWMQTASDDRLKTRLIWCLVPLYIAAMLAALPSWIRLQCSVTAMVALLTLLQRALPSQAGMGHDTAAPAAAWDAAR